MGAQEHMGKLQYQFKFKKNRFNQTLFTIVNLDRI